MWVRTAAAAALVMCTFAWSVSTAAGQASGQNRKNAVMFIHGLDAVGTPGADCQSTWGNMISALKGWGWNNEMSTIGYYVGDTNCSFHTVYPSDGHERHHSNGHELSPTGSKLHSHATPIRHLGYHVAWNIYYGYTFHGLWVDVVGHSMGGLIARYALAQVSRGHPDFPPYLFVRDVVTLGTPHQGSRGVLGAGIACSTWSQQCRDLNPDSDFIDWLSKYAANPQGWTPGTQWTAIVAHDDDQVSAGSGVGMSAAHKVKYDAGQAIEHSDYMNRTSSAQTARVDYFDLYENCNWCRWTSAPWPVRWADYALSSDGW